MKSQRHVNVEQGKKGFQRKPDGSIAEVELGSSFSSEMMNDLLAASRAGADDIERYVRSPFWEVRCEAAMNRHCDDAMLTELAGDDDKMVRWTVASRLDSPVGRTLVSDPSVMVRFAAIERTDIDPSQRAAVLAADPEMTYIAARISRAV